MADLPGNLVKGIELGVFQADPGCDAAIKKLIGIQVSTKAIEDRLIDMSLYMDDPHWCAMIQKKRGLVSVAFPKDSFEPRFKLTLAVHGITNPLLDPRLVALVRETFQYKQVSGFVVNADGWRLSAVDGGPVSVRWATNTRCRSKEKITRPYLIALEQQHLGFGVIFPGCQEANS